MGNPIEWLDRLINSKPTVTVQPRCVCGKFCSTHDAAPDVVAMLVAELSAQGKPVPAYFRSTPSLRGENA